MQIHLAADRSVDLRREGVGRKLIKRPRGLGGLMGPGFLVYTSARHLEDGQRRWRTQGQIAVISPHLNYNAFRRLQICRFAPCANLKGQHDGHVFAQARA